MNRLLEDIPTGLILEDEETIEMKTKNLLGAETEPPTEERGWATQEVTSQQYANANGKGGMEERHDSGHSCQGLPILTTNDVARHQEGSYNVGQMVLTKWLPTGLVHMK